jgi:hypothetical protein
MKLLTAFFIVILFAVFNVSAQKSGQPSQENVFAGGDLTPAMVDRAIGFFEWTLEVEFSDEERTQMESEIVENWKKRNCSEISGLLYALRLAEDRKNWETEELEQLRLAYKARFLRQFERSGSKNINLLIMSLAQRQRESPNQD